MPTHDKPVALVTGGSRGIGYGIAQALAARGMSLVINGRRPESDVAEAIHGLSPAETLYCQADVANLDDHARMLDAIRDRFGRLDVLVNNAGVAPDVRADLLDASPESFDRLISINLRGPYFLTQAVAKWMIEQRQQDAERQPTIVNVSSISAVVASTNRGDYCISKAGVGMATQLWAARLGEHGIPVYEVRPGVIRTDMTAGVTDKYDKLISEGLTVEPRWGLPEDIGRAVATLASGGLSYATGNVLYIDGGLTSQRL
ncbi:3-oxoacyl-[acyl-carrier-protein] reductase FabG [Posidoniimonas polymericola]|uniref:3-oxoacyl-[acyl-carrier-protein] reductase FabG n=1 Tax=Posidoniimonas polymericola TaxID=2528002 RepID=A0A5C5YCR7_9BACT|nr:3-ketoacyl-ACP reductase [Posidoniimonas polymericola]TWT72739.1 3-oxoacyl-[acyl-carrier-protein] reductase FabG [Posidoniimonas polymericola]